MTKRSFEKLELGSYAESGMWFIVVMGAVIALIVVALSGLAVNQNRNFNPDEPTEDLIYWMSIGSIAIASTSLLVSPWLLFKPWQISALIFFFMFLVLSIIVVSVLAILQTQQTDPVPGFETAILWVCIACIIIAIGSATGIGITLANINGKMAVGGSSSSSNNKTIDADDADDAVKKVMDTIATPPSTQESF